MEGPADGQSSRLVGPTRTNFFYTGQVVLVLTVKTFRGSHLVTPVPWLSLTSSSDSPLYRHWTQASTEHVRFEANTFKVGFIIVRKCGEIS